MTNTTLPIVTDYRYCTECQENVRPVRGSCPICHSGDLQTVTITVGVWSTTDGGDPDSD